MASKMLNLGCGLRRNASWENYDSNPSSDDVHHIDLRERLPFADGSVDVIYSSHVIEHLTRCKCVQFVSECYRVLKKNGLLRLATPNLEIIAREYLANFEKALRGKKDAEHNYDWILLEMYDQSIRNSAGGDMLRFFCRDDIPNWSYIKARCGSEAEKLKSVGARLRQNDPFQSGSEKATLLGRMKKIVRAILLRSPSERREKRLKNLLGEEYTLLELGRFRNAGEIHYWMYDQFSLTRLLHKSGFLLVDVPKASESRIPDWNRIGLDADERGEPFKPDSIFIEATK